MGLRGPCDRRPGLADDPSGYTISDDRRYPACRVFCVPAGLGGEGVEVRAISWRRSARAWSTSATSRLPCLSQPTPSKKADASDSPRL